MSMQVGHKGGGQAGSASLPPKMKLLSREGAKLRQVDFSPRSRILAKIPFVDRVVVFLRAGPKRIG